MEDGQPNENQNEQNLGQENAPDTQTDEQENKPTRGRRKQENGPCPDCVNKRGVSTGLQNPRTLCPTCNGSGSVAVV